MASKSWWPRLTKWNAFLARQRKMLLQDVEKRQTVLYHHMNETYDKHRDGNHEPILIGRPFFGESVPMILVAPAFVRVTNEGFWSVQLILVNMSNQPARALYMKASPHEVPDMQAYPVNTILILKNTFFVDMDNDDIATFVLHSMKNLELADETTNRFPRPPNLPLIDVETAEMLKTEGNKHYEAGKYKEALKCYELAIKADRLNPILFSNESALYAAIGNAKKALTTAELGLSLDPSIVRLHFRKAFALRLLDRNVECVKYLTDPLVARICEGDADIAEILQLAQEAARHQSSKNGPYDIREFFEKSLIDPHLPLPDYFDEELLESTPVNGYSFGLIVKRSIKAGTLIFCVKPTYLGFDRPSNDKIVDGVAAKLNEDQQQALLFHHLACASDLDFPSQYDMDNPAHRKLVGDTILPKLVTGPLGPRRLMVTGFWLHACLVHTKCVDANSSCQKLGEYVLIRAIRDIEKGECLSTQLPIFKMAFEQRHLFYLDLGYICNCRLCLLESSERSAFRKSLKSQSDAMVTKLNDPPITAATITAIERQLDAFLKLRSYSPDMFPEADNVNSALAEAYYMIRQYDQAIDKLAKLFERRSSLKWMYEMIHDAARLYLNYRDLGNKVMARKWGEKAVELAVTHFGDEKFAMSGLPDEISSKLSLIIRAL